MTDHFSMCWQRLPADAQRLLSGQNSKCIELWFYDDGTPLSSPTVLGVNLGMHLLQYANVPDTLQCVAEFVESETRILMEREEEDRARIRRESAWLLR